MAGLKDVTKAGKMVVSKVAMMAVMMVSKKAAWMDGKMDDSTAARMVAL